MAMGGGGGEGQGGEGGDLNRGINVGIIGVDVLNFL